MAISEPSRTSPLGSTENTKRPDLRRGLVCRTGQGEIDAFLSLHSDSACNLTGDFAQRERVRFTHVGKTDTEIVEIGPAKRIDSHEIDVIRNEHQIAGFERRVDATGRIRDDELLDPESAEDARQKRHLGHLVPFVEVHAALHHCDRNITGAAEDEATLVSDD